MVTLETAGNCPNCGAPIRGDECPYCGTAFTRKHEGIPIHDPYGNYITTMLSSNLLTPNEARNLLGLPPLEPFDICTFQKANGLMVDGIIGPQTRAAMEHQGLA